MIKDGDRLRAAAGDKRVRVRVAAAGDPAASGDLLADLAGDASRSVRRVVAGRPDTPAHALAALVHDPDRQTRETLAANPGAPAEVLVALISDPHRSVRFVALDNPAGGGTLHRAVCADGDQDLRRNLAQDPDLSAGIAALLLADPSAEVRAALGEATGDAATLATLLTDPDPQVRSSAGMNKHTTAEQRRAMVHDPSWGVRNAVVQAMSTWGWNVPEEDLLLLARDRSVNVRYWLANLPGATRAVYEILAADSDEMVAHTAARWLLPPEDPSFPGNAGARTLGELEDFLGFSTSTQGHFERADQLGRPIPHGRPEVTGEHLLDRLRELGAP